MGRPILAPECDNPECRHRAAIAANAVTGATYVHGLRLLLGAWLERSRLTPPSADDADAIATVVDWALDATAKSLAWTPPVGRGRRRPTVPPDDNRAWLRRRLTELEPPA